ncbi:hypothetical protein [Amycolatopsis anabasis]|uniref:hypothetical protein n=1 Tax=Amycolatopsis anabasis TaxID=1840409 RepID=UPI00131E1F3E|nr:hypothetical protein [Amycolatopsis anabasis]
MRAFPAIGLLFLATACGAPAGAGDGHPCTEIGTPVGISIDIAAPLADRARAVNVTVCWAGSCQAPRVDLFPSSEAGQSGCAGEVCSAQARPTGAKHGFADVPGLPASPVRVTLALVSESGSTFSERVLEVTPALAYPNGPDCGAGGPQAGLTVAPDGTVTQRR